MSLTYKNILIIVINVKDSNIWHLELEDTI
jgi:hypothetical protein